MNNNILVSKTKTLTNKLAPLVKTTNYLAVAIVLALSTTLALVLTLIPTNKAYAITPPDSCFNFNAGTNTITDYYDNENNNPSDPACPKAVDIPSTIGGTAVTTIGNSAFSGNQLTSVTIPSSVTTIGDEAFSSNQLTSVTIPSSVATAGSGIFGYNPITSFSYNGTTYTSSDPITDDCYNFNSGTNTIEGFYFADITNMNGGGQACLNKTLNIPSTIGGEAVNVIGNEAFIASSLTSVVIPSSVTSIGNAAFYGNQLTSVTIPSSVTSIDDNVFVDNNLEEIIVGSGVTSIGDMAFAVQSKPGGTSFIELQLN
ncbi:MAG: leucine-rich repeat domain-containing protein, partial [Microthrixaceae bacterium]|nr:leucine-rich repeat domain-containing protein [Microthrixaceae bacterium]